MIIECIRFLRRIIEPKRAATPAPQAVSLREEYEAIPRGPGGVRRKRNSVAALAARHKMTVGELKSAVRRDQ